MAKVPHEALHRIFRESPTLFTDAIQRVFETDFPEIVEVSVIDADLTEHEVIERRVDTVLRAETSDGPQLLVIEAQTKEAPEKIRGWAYYLSYLENKYALPATLLIMTPNASTARWARGPLRLGPANFPSMELYPFVCGPDNLPIIAEVELAAEDVEFAVLAALVHRLNPDIEKALRPLAAALDTIDPMQGARWAVFVEGGLGEGCARETWRKIMKTMQYRYVSEIGRESRAEGRVEGYAEAILDVLDERGVSATDAERQRIHDCMDALALKRWLRRAMFVDRVEDLFAD